MCYYWESRSLFWFSVKQARLRQICPTLGCIAFSSPVTTRTPEQRQTSGQKGGQPSQTDRQVWKTDNVLFTSLLCLASSWRLLPRWNKLILLSAIYGQASEKMLTIKLQNLLKKKSNTGMIFTDVHAWMGGCGGGLLTVMTVLSALKTPYQMEWPKAPSIRKSKVFRKYWSQVVRNTVRSFGEIRLTKFKKYSLLNIVVLEVDLK